MSTDINQILTSLGLDPAILEGGDLEVHSPIDGSLIGSVRKDTAEGL